MHASIEKHRAEIEELCRRYGVRTLDVFGSATTDGFDEDRSDVDFIVDFSEAARRNYFHAYFDLKEALEALLGRRVDMMTAGPIRNPFLRRGVEETREPLYAA